MEEARHVKDQHSAATNATKGATANETGGRNTRNTGPGRLLIAVYAVFAISASARLIFRSASYFWILSRRSPSFLAACWILVRLLV